jgi:hypothetical protein
MDLKISLLTILLLCWVLELIAQPASRNIIKPLKINNDIGIDGILNEPQWKGAETAGNFHQNYPSDSSLARGKTSVWVLYNEKYLYIGAELLNADSLQKNYVASSLKRDFPFLENDAFGLTIDPFGDHINGYGFYLSAYGVQREEQIYSGSNQDDTWDIKWFSAIHRTAIGWTLEIVIPFRYLRYSRSLDSWNINFLRNDIVNNERSSWIPTPRNFTFPNLAYTGKIEWPQIPKQAPKNISLIPSLTLSANQNKKEKIQSTVKPSLDAKITMTSSLNLDLTVNPDFSQVEVDDAQVNLSRFELSYPEKRLFFIENSDLFSQFGVDKLGTSPVRPVYSRRIGIKYNTQLGQFEPARVIAGARLSGKISNDLRIGVMSVQTASQQLQDSVLNSNSPGQNYSVVALQQKVFSSSNIGVIFTNRQSTGADSTTGNTLSGKYNRLIGAEYNLTSRNGEWTGKLFEQVMFTPQKTTSSQGGWLNYNTRHTISWVGFTRVGKDFNPDVGFVPRDNFSNVYGELSYIAYTKSKALLFLRPVIHYELYLGPAYTLTDHSYIGGTEIALNNTTDIYLLFHNAYTRLMQPFNPALNNGKSLPAGSAYNYSFFSFYYLSDLRKNFAWEYFLRLGKYFNGTYTEHKGYFNVKIQPWGIIGVNYDINMVRLPAPYSNNNIYAVGPKADISFSRKLYFNTNIQYTSANRNLNFFFRLQWRFKQLSDIYVVYSNNESTQPWQHQNHNLTVKFIYFW